MHASRVDSGERLDHGVWEQGTGAGRPPLQTPETAHSSTLPLYFIPTPTLERKSGDPDWQEPYPGPQVYGVGYPGASPRRMVHRAPGP